MLRAFHKNDKKMNLRGEVRQADMLWLLGSLCGLFRIPFDAALLARDYPPPHTLATLHDAARALGIRTGHRPLLYADWQKLPLPAIAFLPPPDSTAAAAGDAPRPDPGPTPNADPNTNPAPAFDPLLIVKASADQLLYFRPGSQTPETLPIADAARQLAPELLLVAREATVGTDEHADIAGFTPEKKAFGFRWFIPELKKHKSLWRDVLLASFAIQLVGLTTPVFTQVIIDKVVVHQSNSTLVVLGVALVMFMLFTSGMSWLRQYLVLHTVNRIYAVLGSQVFPHLLRLPLPYF